MILKDDLRKMRPLLEAAGFTRFLWHVEDGTPWAWFSILSENSHNFGRLSIDATGKIECESPVNWPALSIIRSFLSGKKIPEHQALRIIEEEYGDQNARRRVWVFCLSRQRDEHL